MTYDALRWGRYSEPGRIYHLVFTTERRRPLFHDFNLARLAVHHLRLIDERAWTESLAWVVMPDHVHWLFSLGEAVDLARVAQTYKGGCARAINLRRGTTGTVWQRAYYDHAVRKEEDIQVMARYIVANPVRAGLVSRVGDYPHWDAVWL
jgi:putative transposase